MLRIVDRLRSNSFLVFYSSCSLDFCRFWLLFFSCFRLLSLFFRANDWFCVIVRDSFMLSHIPFMSLLSYPITDTLLVISANKFCSFPLSIVMVLADPDELFPGFA